jgi:hypothetical protein
LREVDARKNCFYNNLATYRFSSKETILGEAYTKDSALLSTLRITFLPDSTFHTNFKVSFSDDTVGWWNAGTCGFESFGTMGFYSSPHKISFSPGNDTIPRLIITGKRRKEGIGSEYLYFERENR